MLCPCAYLQRRPRDEQAELRVERPHRGGEAGLFVLDAVRLVDGNVDPVDLVEKALVEDDDLVGRHDDVEHARLALLVADTLALFPGAVQLLGADHGAPLFELAQPVAQRRLGHDDEVRPRDAAHLVEVAQDGDRLQGLAQPHLVGQDGAAVGPAPVEGQPVEPGDLVRVQLEGFEFGLLLGHGLEGRPRLLALGTRRL